MAWTPIKLPDGPIAKADSATEGDCGLCGSVDGEPCEDTTCGTYDYED